MNGRGLLGGLGGLIGVGLLSKGAMRGGFSLLTNLLGGLSGTGGGGGRGMRGGSQGFSGGKGRGKGGGNNNDGSLLETLQKAMALLQERQAVAAEAQKMLPDGEVLDVEGSPLEGDRQQEALALLAESLVSYLPGRARVRSALLKKKGDFLSVKAELLEAGFQDIHLNSTSGSVLLLWDASTWDQSAFFVAAMPLGRYLLNCARL